MQHTEVKSVSIGSFHRILAASLALAMVSSLSLSCGSAQALFGLFKHKHKGDEQSKSKRKKRQVAGVEVGLVPGAPAALYWKPSGTPKAVVLCLHELGLHKGVFDDLGQRLSQQQIAVYAIDLRGFGGWTEKDTDDAKMNLAKTLD
ncbi:MAG: alpha/beta hydrolase, partial [Candidatus Angelobacter sp.]